MEHMITRGIKYKGLRSLFNNNDAEIQSIIAGIKDATFKARLIDEAKQYYAKIYKTDKSNIYYGNLYTSPSFEFPYEYVIGDLEINEAIKMNKLKGVTGDLSSTYVKHFYSLEFVGGNIKIGHPSFFDNYYSVRLPLLKHCSSIHIFNSIVKDLPIKTIDSVKIKNSVVKGNAFGVEKAKELIIIATKIFDITSLEEVDDLVIHNVDTDVLLTNTNLKVNNTVSTNESDFKQRLIVCGNFTI